MKNRYEIGYVMNPESTEEEVKKFSDSILEIIKKAKGNVENVDEWGRKPLAYPIQNHVEGIFTFVTTDMESNIVSTLERRMKLNEKVMRFIVLRLDDKLKKANKLVKRWQKIEKITRKSKESTQREAAGEDDARGESEVKNEE